MGNYRKGGLTAVGPPTFCRSGQFASPQLRDLELEHLGLRLRAFLRPGQGLGDGFEAHALRGERVELRIFLEGPGLLMSCELLGHGQHIAPRGSGGNPRPASVRCLP